MAEIKVPSITVATTTEALDVPTTINTSIDLVISLDEADEYSSTPSSSQEPCPTSSSSSSSSSNSNPSSSTSLDSLSNFDDTKEESLSCEKIAIHLPENKSLSDENCQELIPTPPKPPSPQPKAFIVREMIVDDAKQDKSFARDTSLVQPIRRGYFSCLLKPDGKLSYNEDLKSLRYLNIPGDIVSINLRDDKKGDDALGYSFNNGLQILRYISNNHYDLLEYRDDNDDYDEAVISDDEDAGDDLDDKKQPIADVICTSKILTMIMSTPYNKQNGWNLIGVNVNGALIIIEKETSEQSKRFYESRKFLEGVTRRYDGIKTNPEGHDLFYTVSQSKVGNHRLLYSSRISAAIKKRDSSEETIDSMMFVHTQLRSVTWMKDSKSKKNFWRNHGLNLWCQSLLDKIDLVLFGEKEPGGWVKQLDRTKPEDFPKSGNIWSPKTCVDFMDQLFTLIRTPPLPELTPFEIVYNHETRKIICSTLDEPVENFLPLWYLNNQSPDEDD